jgi:hypothetical protein
MNATLDMPGPAAAQGLHGTSGSQQQATAALSRAANRMCLSPSCAPLSVQIFESLTAPQPSDAVQGAQLLHMAATPNHIAVATSAGGIHLVSAASLTQLSTLSEPGAAGGQNGKGGERGCGGSRAVRACAFSPDGSMLIAACASGRLVAWDLRNVERPSAALLYQAHRSAGRVAGVTKGVASHTQLLSQPVPVFASLNTQHCQALSC